ncbi:hypothetical protein H072_8188 [Dactylellina haptotyla CBS 200.50]|uniref:Aldehyde dehydrogenase domain-containing protein n=1 Tax=Dactylellina haptotyla (strain CBS 200.50) TaxID=1284197 RepID=S8A5G4_DACHA|nr:hypothetical protein H072_8188 [Dactylellina haptotyla CBS 200.50]
MSFEKESNFCVPFWIDGTTICPEDSPRYDVTTPPSQALTWTACAASPATVDEAIASASKAFITWSKTPLPDRISIFSKAASILESSASEVQYYFEKEIGAGIGWSAFNQSFCVKSLGSIGNVLEEALRSETIDGGDSMTAMLHRVPYGVVGAIAPCATRNAPLILGLRAVLAPIAAGNTVVMLAAPLSPMTHHFIALLLHSAGLPPGVLNVLPAPSAPGNAAEVVETLLKHPAVQYLNFTGSTAVGRKINEVAGRYGKPVTMELGGKCVALALKDADLDTLAQELVVGAYLNSGQICMSTELAIIPSPLIPTLVQKIVDSIRIIFPESQLPLVTGTAKDKLLGLLKDAIEKGAVVYSSSGEEAPATLIDSITADASSSVPLLFLTKVTKDMSIYQTETFGPIFSIVEYDGENPHDGIALANELEFGLSVSIFSKNEVEAIKLGEYIDSGAVHINHMTVYDNPVFPHGGVKASGYGRFGGKWGIQEFTYIKTITFKKPVA